MPDTIFKTFRAEVKGVNTEDGSLNLFIPVSTNSVDRDGEIVEPSAFKKTLPKFMKRPVLVSSHDYRDLTSQIGEWEKLRITENGIEGKPKYYVGQGNEQADWGFKLASKGMAAFSIGFIPTKWEDGDGVKSPRRTYQEVELLEISQVIVPSNRDAIQSIRSKGFDNEVVNKLLDDVLADKELVTKPEETENMYRIPVPGEAGKHTDHKIRTMDISKEKGVKGLYCIDDKKIITYMFDKEKWDSMEATRDWMMEHMGKSFVIIDNLIDYQIKRAKPCQEEIIDEIDYLKSLIANGLNDDARKSFNELVKSAWGEMIKMDMGKMQEMHDMMASCEGMAKKAKKMSEDMMSEKEDMKRITGSDIPVDIKLPKDELTFTDILDAVKRIKTEVK